MCIGDWLKPDIPAPPPLPDTAPPPLPQADPPPEMGGAEEVRPEADAAEISTERRKKLQVQKAQEGVREFGAVDPSTTPSSPEGGITNPGV